jgi:choline dehydrogenase-like flavoprotein
MTSKEPVDVLIVGAGASGAAFAWSLAETRMNILCLEQGPWMKPERYPTTGLDWEARSMGDFSVSPNVRQLPQDYPIHDADAAISPSMFNAVGGGTMLYAGKFPLVAAFIGPGLALALRLAFYRLSTLLDGRVQE